MIVRQLPDEQALVISQESHADVAAQFAAHWGGGGGFARLEPYESMVFGTVYHDSGHREMEASLPVNAETGLPYNFRGAPPEIRDREADGLNSLWIRKRDPYAALIVSMHHAGLRKRRYDTVRVRKPGPAEDSTPLGMEDAFADLQGWQRETADALGLADPQARRRLWHNYQMLQVFDLLSLHFCCDGYRGGRLQPVVLERVPVSPESGELVDVELEPVGPSAMRFKPYPLDGAPLEIGTLGRRMPALKGEPGDAVKAAYHAAPRVALCWQLVA